jgi:hypothetical protein
MRSEPTITMFKNSNTKMIARCPKQGIEMWIMGVRAQTQSFTLPHHSL